MDNIVRNEEEKIDRTVDRNHVTTVNHWYDGLFYDRFIAPNQDPLYTSIIALIDPESRVLDVGCGTGRLAWRLSEKCALIHGIDPSRRNIERAKKIWEKRGRPTSVRFSLGTLKDHILSVVGPYDYAVVSYVLHELDEAERLPMLRSLAGSARKLILADYHVPRRRGIMDAATEVVEFLAGREHYRGFRSFVQTGGLRPLMREAGLTLIEESDSAPSTADLLLAGTGEPSRRHHSQPNPL